ncbi:MAG TPA: uroporphyrinogen decarboxylase family protein [Bacillota bacterium]|nr:uroporphyrinogen decarboxylase family protein [Bacillota bacterium]
MIRPASWIPDFHNLELVLKKQKPPRPVMFDFIIGDEKTRMLAKEDYRDETELDRVVTTLKAFENAGYDHSPIIVRGLDFTRKTDRSHQNVQTKSLNSGATITSRETFESYKWPELSDCDFSIIHKAGKHLTKGVLFVPFSLDGILENTIGIVGYENLCYMLYDDYDLAADIFKNVGTRIAEYFEICLNYSEVGAVLLNDDWGFNSQTMVPPDILRKHVFPWYQKVAEKAHKMGKYALLHSCGYYQDIIDDIIDVIKIDGRHSYEDKIVPVENAYRELNPRLAILGGMDVDFLSRSQPSQIYARCVKMLKLSAKSGGYALGSGNSIPDYISNENYLAMLKAAYDMEDEYNVK